jgi:hypothetical protein
MLKRPLADPFAGNSLMTEWMISSACAGSQSILGKSLGVFIALYLRNGGTKMEMIRALAAETPELPRINTLFLDQYLRRRPTSNNRLSRKDHAVYK